MLNLNNKNLLKNSVFKIFLGSLFSIFFLSILFANFLLPKKDLTVQKSQAAISSNPNLKYFGYYFTDGLPVGSAKDYLNEINTNFGNSNVYHLMGYLDKNTMISYLQIAKQNNAKLIINMEQLLFDTNTAGQLGNGGKKLYSDWQTKWNTIKTNIQGYESYIYAFYFDEPYWIGISQNDFINVTQTIKNDVALFNIRLMAVEATIPIDPVFYGFNISQTVTSSYYQNITDLGFDDYVYGRSGAGGWAQYNNLLKKLEIIAPTQRIWLIPESFVVKSSIYGGTDPSILATYWDTYYQIAQSDNRIFGMLSFIYVWDIANPTAAGPDRYPARDLMLPSSSQFNKTFHDKSISIGKEIINNTPTPTQTTTPNFTPTNTFTPTLTPVSCLCQSNNLCSTSCSFNLSSNGTYPTQLSCTNDSLYSSSPSSTDKDNYCNRTNRTLGDADGSGTVDSLDYIYYVRAVNGGAIPAKINTDFNGDGVTSVSDRSIVVQSIPK